MSTFDGKRLTNETFKLDVERMRRGWYSDKYFENINRMLIALSKEGYSYNGQFHNLPAGFSAENISVGDIEVEMQWFTRRLGTTVIVGVDKALEMIRHCAGYWDNERFIETANELEVWAVQDGDITESSDGNPMNLTRSSRVATNVYETLTAAHGKPVLFFPARFDLHEVQASDGYAYNIAVQRFNMDYSQKLGPFVSTDAQGDWWGGAGGGTVAHAAIASFLGDTAEAMMEFSRILPAPIPRIALVDFNNDSVRDTLRVLNAMFIKYRELVDAGNKEEAEKYKLYGVRLDTSGTLRDVSVLPLGDPSLDLGVNPRLVFNIRQALDSASENWSLPKVWQKTAREYCRNVKIVVSGGFNPEKIRKFEKLGVPADIYAVGSYLFINNGTTASDFTADVVRVKIHGEWLDMSKVGRRPRENANMKRAW
ncbi:MAG: nicotinate phosphoribosyltransferase [Chloroflexi bacterium]|nr:nicotinate phosphoribosyltransferase [Chloroflexota bacterium]